MKSGMDIKELKEKIKNNIHIIYNVSLLNEDMIEESDLEDINISVYCLYKDMRDLVSLYENKILNLGKEIKNLRIENENLSNELLTAEVALNKATHGKIHEAMDCVKIEDIFFSVDD